jgi:cytochrome o ubiquinol oxidase subunit 1
MKNRGYSRPLQGFKPIHMPKNTGTGAILSAFSIAFAFGMIWYIWWLVAVSFIATMAIAIWHTFNYKRDFYIPAEDISAEEGRRTELLTRQV